MKEIITRDKVKDENKWDVESVFKTEKDFKEEFEKFKDMKFAEEVNSKKGKLGSLNGKQLCEFFEKHYDDHRKLEKLYTYAHLKRDEDLKNTTNEANFKLVKEVYNDYSVATSWIDTEIVAFSEEKIKEIKEDENMKDFKIAFERIVRMKDHTLSEEVEKTISLAGKVHGTISPIYGQLTDNDMEFPKVKDKDGKEHTLTHGAFGSLIRSKDRVLRKEAFETYHTEYKKYESTICAIYNSVIQKNVFHTTIRKYDSCLHKSLFHKNIDTSVYLNLIKATHDGIDALHEYIKMRKEILGVEELHLYDLYVPLIDNKSFGKDSILKENYTFEEGVDMCIEAVKPLGKEYQETLKKGLKEERWVDRYENKAKRSGAYSSGCYDTRPFILMNFDGKIDDIYTAIHEGGHSMHSYLSNTHQKYQYADYSIFVAEIASIFNENCLSNHLLENAKTKEEKMFILNKMIENIRTTFFRQTLFAEFEHKMHEFAEKKVPITTDLINKTYYELYKLYYGAEGVVIDELIKSEAIRIPHFFYYDHYVFQYSTGIAGAFVLSKKVREGGEKDREAYLNFLKSGCSDWPIEVLKKAGVDFTSTQPFFEMTKIFKSLVQQFKELYFSKK